MCEVSLVPAVVLDRAHLAPTGSAARSEAGCCVRTQCPVRISRSSGCTLLQSSVPAYLQRGAKRHASGGMRRSGGRPGIVARRSFRGSWSSMCGSDPRSASVYGMLGPVEEIGHRRLLDDLAGVHDEHLLGRLGDHAHVVRDDDHRHPVVSAELVEGLEHARLDGDVERGGRLVGDQQLRAARERHRDHHALAHPSGEPVGVVAEPPLGVGDVHLLEEAHGALVSVCLGEPEVAADRLGDLRADGQRRVERRHRVLEDHRDLLAADVLERLVGHRGQLPVLEADRAGHHAPGGLHETHDRERGDGLAAAGLAHDPEHRPLLDLERDAVDGVHLALAGLEVGAEVLDFEQRQLRFPSSADRARRAGRRR